MTTRLPPDLRATLRACRDDPGRAMFLDIETTGLSHVYDEVTVIGWTLEGRSGTRIGREPAHDLAVALANARCMITFNGTRFDRRFLARDMPDLKMPPYHVDLMYLCRRVGLTGGQKAIERELGIDLRGDLADVDGAEAVLLWHAARRGDLAALEALIAYNRADIAAMGAIFDTVWNRLPLDADLFDRSVGFAAWADPADRSDVKGHFALPRVPPPPCWGGLFGGTSAEDASIVGIDLTGSAKRGSGFAHLRGSVAEVATLHTDDELLRAVRAVEPALVSIDSPLCLPAGRSRVEDDDPMRDAFGIMRVCERELKRRGVNVYPCLLPSMQKLTARGIEIAERLRGEGIAVIESYPGAAQDIMHIPRKGAGVEWLRRGLVEFGLEGAEDFANATHDELDAVTSALVGAFQWIGRAEELSGPGETALVIPDLNATRHACVVGISGPIASGKTTVARMLEDRGFAYTRFSLAVDEVVRAQGLVPGRRTRQEIGAAIHAEPGGQRRLAERALQIAGDSNAIVVDGLRFPTDHAYLSERYGAHYVHLHVTAPRPLRRMRYEGGGYDREFDVADRAPVEAMTKGMSAFAHRAIENAGSMADLERCVQELALKSAESEACP